jgi:hypothetical protein
VKLSAQLQRQILEEIQARTSCDATEFRFASNVTHANPRFIMVSFAALIYDIYDEYRLLIGEAEEGGRHTLIQVPGSVAHEERLTANSAREITEAAILWAQLVQAELAARPIRRDLGAAEARLREFEGRFDESEKLTGDEIVRIRGILDDLVTAAEEAAEDEERGADERTALAREVTELRDEVRSLKAIVGSLPKGKTFRVIFSRLRKYATAIRLAQPLLTAFGVDTEGVALLAEGADGLIDVVEAATTEVPEA